MARPDAPGAEWGAQLPGRRPLHKKTRSSRMVRVAVISFVFFAADFQRLQKLLMPLTVHFEFAEPGSGPAATKRSADAKRVPKPVDTLVHFDPRFTEGFRNQAMRFIAFVDFAVRNNITQILLPSLRWGDLFSPPNSLRHDLLFDVAYWNSRAEELGLPLLVDYDPNILEGVLPSDASNGSNAVIPCFNETSGLYSGLDESYIRSPTTNLRRMNPSIWNLIGRGGNLTHCRRTPGGENNPAKIEAGAKGDTSDKVLHRYTHLIPHGGMQGSGRLWTDYFVGMKSRRNSTPYNVTMNDQTVQMYPEHIHVEKAVLDILRPSRYIRLAIDNAITAAVKNKTSTEKRPRLLALHPRVEHDMLLHFCHNLMENNLTRVWERMESFPDFRDAGRSGFRFDLAFLAISKGGVEKPASAGGVLGQIMDHNRESLKHARQHGLFGKTVPIFESGADSASKVKFPITRTNTDEDEVAYVTAGSLGVLEIVASVIDFFTAVQADIFVGVKGSTFSTDVFSVRYYQNKGENYIVGRDGIVRLYGPSPVFSCCKPGRPC